MNKSWRQLEDYVRSLAELRWKKVCAPEHLSGVDFDGVIRVDSGEYVLIEITKERNLEKVRSDIHKLNMFRISQAAQGIVCKCFVIIEDTPTDSMREAGFSNHIKVCSVNEFEKEFYDFEHYNSYRKKYPFGSAVDSQTGENDSRKYIEVNYEDLDTHRKYTYGKIAKALLEGQHVILTGDYGTGKSRCVKEIYTYLSNNIQNASAYPLAINLKDHWSSSNAVGIIADHLGGLGLSTSIDNTIQLLNAGHLILLLDGFDEIGTQIHDPRIEDRKNVRKKAVSGVRDLIHKSKRGCLIAGRSHFFDSQDEMLESLGLSNKLDNTLLLSVPDSFSTSEAKKYLQTLGVDADIPNWLPKKPLVFQILVELNRNDLTRILSKEFTQYTFWSSFISAVCRRESVGVKDTISPSTILRILEELATKTRFSKSNEFLGRLSPSDIDIVYKKVVGSVPDENGRQLLSRMCMLGRIDPSSPDRQFVDASVLDILRAHAFIQCIVNMWDIGNEQWVHSLRDLGLIHAASMINYHDLIQQCLVFMEKFVSTKNTKSLGELISVLSLLEIDIDTKLLTLSNSCIPVLNLAKSSFSNLTIQDSEIGWLLLNNTAVTDENNLVVSSCIINRATGITNEKGFPSWIKNCDTISFDMVNNATLIKESSLTDPQKLLLSIIQKIFFQWGKGRDDKTLYRGGYGLRYDNKTIDAILRILLQAGVIEKIEQNGVLYKPVRKYTARMDKIRSELTLSDDPIWLEVSSI